MKVTITLADPEERHTVVVDGRDQRAFELQAHKDFGVKPFTDSQAALRAFGMNAVYWQAYNAMRRAGVEITWEEFAERAADFEKHDDDEEDDEAGPTRPGHGPG